MKYATCAGAFMVAALFASTTPVAPGQDLPPTEDPSSAQQESPAAPAAQTSTLDDTLEAGEAGGEEPVRKLVKWNEFEGKHFSIRVGGGFLYEFAAFAQDDDSKEQFMLEPQTKFRDGRVLLKGKLKFIKRPVTWSMGIMYDAPNEQWVARQTGLMIDVPEISGQIFIGRTKEGFSLNKVMVGYAGWTAERATISDTIPILADGIKWLGYSPKRHFLWNLGFYGDWMSQSQGFSTYDHQFVGRFAWVPIVSEETVLHVGVSARYGEPKDGKLRVRSRPEAFPAPYFVDTGQFPAKDTRMLAPEIYYRPGSLLVGSEYFFQKVNAPASGDPFFHGGDVFISWLATGEIRSYNTRGGYFNGVSPARPVFQGGPGAWEFVARFSYIDLDSQTLRGGKFWRITPMANWHLSDNVRLEMTYGYGSLNRFDLTGRTQFFQTRLQLQL
ncbi:MAG TPA: porin [Terriglobia bacterium]|nr:porin [Terriglobia bacterium]